MQKQYEECVYSIYNVLNEVHFTKWGHTVAFKWRKLCPQTAFVFVLCLSTSTWHDL